jgi:hypothetical protein
MVLNFQIQKDLPWYPILSCLKKTGPLEVNLTAAEMMKNSGRLIVRNTEANMKSNARFANRLKIVTTVSEEGFRKKTDFSIAKSPKEAAMSFSIAE